MRVGPVVSKSSGLCRLCATHVLTVQAVGNQKVVRMFGKLAYFGKAELMLKERTGPKGEPSWERVLKASNRSCSRCFHETLSDAHGFHDREEKISSKGCIRFFVAGDRMVAHADMPPAAKRANDCCWRIGIACCCFAVVSEGRSSLSFFLLKADKTGEVRYLLFAHLIEFGYFVRIVSMMG